MGANLPGHEALLNTLAFDGKTTAPEASMAVLDIFGAVGDLDDLVSEGVGLLLARARVL